METPLNKHQKKTEATRRKLLDAALRVFTRDGFEASRLEDIASEAGHTRGAFYANFTTKEELFIALLEHQASKRMQEFSAKLDTSADPKARTRAIRDFFLNSAKDRSWAVLTLEFKLYALRHSEHRAQLALAHRRIRESFHFELLNRLNAGPAILGEAEKRIKLLLEMVWGGLVLEHAYDPKRVSAEEVNYLLGRMFDLLTSETGSSACGFLLRAANRDA